MSIALASNGSNHAFLFIYIIRERLSSRLAPDGENEACFTETRSIELQTPLGDLSVLGKLE